MALKTIILKEKMESFYSGKCDSKVCQTKHPHSNFKIEEIEIETVIVGGLIIAFQLSFVTCCQYCPRSYLSPFLTIDKDLKHLKDFNFRFMENEFIKKLINLFLKIESKIKEELKQLIKDFLQEYDQDF